MLDAIEKLDLESQNRLFTFTDNRDSCLFEIPTNISMVLMFKTGSTDLMLYENPTIDKKGFSRLARSVHKQIKQEQPIQIYSGTYAEDKGDICLFIAESLKADTLALT